jgi:hypothetical protein
MFIDELSTERFTNKNEWNYFSHKAGFRLSDLPFSNISITGEFTYTYPHTFQHYVPTLTFESANFNLGHYLKDNSKEWYAAIDYRPFRTLSLNVYLVDAVRGEDYTEAGGERLGDPPLESIKWHNTTFGFRASCQVINDLYTWFSFTNSNNRGDLRWAPAYFSGFKNTLNVGLTLGF